MDRDGYSSLIADETIVPVAAPDPGILPPESVELPELIKIRELEVKQKELKEILDGMDEMHKQTRSPVQDHIQRITDEKKKLQHEIQRITDQQTLGAAPAYPPAPGPSDFEFVDHVWFGDVCSAVGVLNVIFMAIDSELHASNSTICVVLDHIFLIWYLFELTVKWKYHRCDLFFGSLYVVWWNWVDAGIVISGVVDQWILGVVQIVAPNLAGMNDNGLAFLRLLRLFRLMRVLKVIKAFVQGDMSWTEQWPFQVFMSAVIAVNSIVMALELDVEWAGWHWVEHAFLITYSFELAVRLKFYGCNFFTNSDYVWNNLDFVMVCGGIVDLWLIPAWSFVEVQLSGEAEAQNGSITSVLKTLKILRILRVLRLVRLLKLVRPLHALLRGVSDALASMQWVMVLALLVLYAGAIIFTSLIGKGYIYNNAADVPPEASTFFGSVQSSLYSLFKLMNGDTSVVDSVTNDPKGQLLFASFMVLSNWAVLAILTSVVSDQMISTSTKLAEEDKTREQEERLAYRRRKLIRLFEKVDEDSSGDIEKSEWQDMLAHPKLKQELCSISGLDAKTLWDVFSCLAEENEDGIETLHYESFVAYLDHDTDTADRRQVLHLQHLMKELEKINLNHMAKVEEHIQHRTEKLEDHVSAEISAVHSMLEKVMHAVNKESPEIAAVQSMLEKVMHAVNKESHRACPPVPHDSERVTMNRIEHSEHTSQHEFNVCLGQEGPPLPNDLSVMIPGKLQLLESMLEKVIHSMDHPCREDPLASMELDKSTLSRMVKLDDATRSKLEALEGMLEKVMCAFIKPHQDAARSKLEALEGMLEKVLCAVSNVHPEDSTALIGSEEVRLSRGVNLEDTTAKKLDVLKGMLAQIIRAVSQNVDQAYFPRPGERHAACLSAS